MMRNSWDNVRTGYLVAKAGTVSAAAHELGIHRATVVRHIDLLEDEVGEKLFIRHERGYGLTDAGRDLLGVGSEIDSLLSAFLGRTRSRAEDGQVILAGSSLVIALFLPVIGKFRVSHPNVRVRYEVETCRAIDLEKLRHGGTHIAAVLGAKPTCPDFIVRNVFNFRVGLYASKSYVETHGLPRSVKDYSKHWFVMHRDPDKLAPFAHWRDEHIPQDRRSIESVDFACILEHLLSGLGIAFLPQHEAIQRNLVEVVSPKEEWDQKCWLVTHRDTRQSANISRFVETVKTHSASEAGFYVPESESRAEPSAGEPEQLANG
ncbi:MAG: LysR family transcriptional regulator [Myxococcota bacterium]